MLNAVVNQVKVFRPDTRILGFPGKSGLIRAAFIKGGHIGIKPHHDLDDIESFLYPV